MESRKSESGYTPKPRTRRRKASLTFDKSGMRLTESLHQAVKERKFVPFRQVGKIGEALLQLCLRLTEESEEVG